MKLFLILTFFILMSCTRLQETTAPKVTNHKTAALSQY
jgi:hypothetical protein